MNIVVDKVEYNTRKGNLPLYLRDHNIQLWTESRISQAPGGQEEHLHYGLLTVIAILWLAILADAFAAPAFWTLVRA